MTLQTVGIKTIDCEKTTRVLTAPVFVTLAIPMEIKHETQGAYPA